MGHARIRAQALFDEDDWTEASFSGPAAEAWAEILAATLNRLGWEVLLSRDEEDFITLGEEEPEE